MYSVCRFNSKKIIPIAASDFCNRYYLTSLNTSGGLTSFFNREPYRCPSVITSNNSFPNYSNFINVFSFLDCIIAPCFLYCKSFLKIYIIQGISQKTPPSCTASYIHHDICSPPQHHSQGICNNHSQFPQDLSKTGSFQ